jgi:hypothetical protein
MDREYWTKQLREAEQELDAATRRSDVDAAAKKLQRAKTALKALEGAVMEESKRRSGRVSASSMSKPRLLDD